MASLLAISMVVLAIFDILGPSCRRTVVDEEAERDCN